MVSHCRMALYLQVPPLVFLVFMHGMVGCVGNLRYENFVGNPRGCLRPMGKCGIQLAYKVSSRYVPSSGRNALL